MKNHSSSLLVLAASLLFSTAEEPVVIDFERAKITGRWIESWEDKGVIFTPAHAPTRSQATSRLMFFPHMNSGRRGIVSAMADDPIPVRVTFPRGATTVKVTLWGSTGCPARLQAFDEEGNVVDEASVDAVPGREAPGDPIPTIELTVGGTTIHYIQFSGPRVGEFLAADEIRFTPPPETTRSDSKH